MNRRGFLRALGVIGAGTLAGEHLSHLIRQPTSIINPLGDWIIDPVTQEIRWVGSSDGFYTLGDFYSWLKNQPAKEFLGDGPPMMASTAWQYEMKDGWTVSDNGIMHLKEGSLKMGDEIFTSVTSIGAVTI